jgi:predicted RNase H-like nuclease (RuvC/YqgF family)
VERLKSSEGRLSAQVEAHEAEVQELKKKVAEATENFNVKLKDQEHRRMSMSFVPPRKML